MLCHCAVLARTGDCSSNDALLAWLRRGGVDVVEAPDALSLCAALMTRAEPPELLIVGSDWLRPSECQVVEYARRAWPDAIVIVHGRDAAAFAGRAIVTIDSPAGLRRLTAAAPDAFLTEHHAYLTVVAEDADEGRASPHRVPRGAGALTATRM